MKRTPKSAAKPVLSLAPVIKLFNSPADVDKETVDVLRSLLRDAEAGKITSFIYAFIKPNGGYAVNVTSIERNNVTFVMGVLEVFKASLLKKILNR